MASSSTTIMATPDVSRKYDVFLSFRGDTRNSFTDHLYEALRGAGIYAFRDNDEIERGEDLQPEIERGISESRASIIVLSKEYATSRWCLDELCLILKQKNHFVFPIFYHVDPSHVRNQEGTFQVNVKTGTKWTADKVHIWKAALYKVGNMTGEVISGLETVFLKKIVATFEDRLDLKKVYRQTNLVGMDTQCKEINYWLDQDDAQILAIWGMGGSGKTTLARHILYSNWENFMGNSILEDIGRKSTEQLHQLQEKLLTEILRGNRRKIPSVSQGTCTIEEALQKKKALILLDNIVESNHVFDLLGTGIKTQSKIIITTRENPCEWFKSKSWTCREFKMKSLDNDLSLELLSLHAFGSKAPMEGYQKLLEKALRYCEGNPLALKVLGSALSDDRTIEFWDSLLKSLEREAHDAIQSVLITSYNSLPQDINKELFLHIACFFVGKDMDYVVNLLEPDYSAISGIKILSKRCLLFVSPEKKLVMHRLLQEMARKIVYDESPKDPAERSRVWKDTESYALLKKRKGSTKMEGLALDMEMLSRSEEHARHRHKSSDLVTDSFKKMDNLKFLQLNWLKLKGSFECISEDLRWLCWLGFREKTIPSELYMGNMVAIDMSHSCLEVFEPPMVLHSLKYLNLKSSAYLLEIRSISRLPNLESLILWNCCWLTHISKTLEDLTRLALLNITGCEKLCKRKEAEASSVGGISKAQTFFHLPCSLQQLFLKDCNVNDTDFFPLGFEDQSFLKYLNLVNSSFELLPSYNHLKDLRVLDLSGCTKLKMLLNLPSTLAQLYIYYCYSLERVTFDTHRYTLCEFGYEGCVNLLEVEGFIRLVPISKHGEADLGHMKWLEKYKDVEVCLVGDDELTKGRSLRLQILYEFNIMSISLPDIQNPNMIPEYMSESSSLSFDLPSCPQNRKLEGLILTFKYTLEIEDCPFFAKISTNNGVELMYNPAVFGKPVSGEVGMWLSYWPIGNKLNVGDKVTVSIVVMNGLELQGCGATLVYTDEVVNETLQANEVCAEILGGDMSDFQLSTGAFYLCRRDFLKFMDAERSTPNWFRNLVGDTIDYTAVRGWTKTGRPQQPYQSYTELKTVRCIIYGPQLDEIYKSAELSKSSLVDKTREFTSQFTKAATEDVNINETMESTSSSLVEKTKYGSEYSRLTLKFEHLKISLEAIKSATADFSNEKFIGEGGFGKVYKGEIEIVHSMGKRVVALKRLNRRYGQGDPEFWKEIIMLSSYKHENIISLLGYCDDSGEKILIYEYASKRSLDLYLHKRKLTWVRRLNICIGAARGLMYLHNAIGARQRVLHRDIKSSNILLDENWNAKISDFGLSKLGPANQQITFLVSNPAGTLGYVDPLYVEAGLLTKESDVYSFGVVLFEVLCGRLCNDDKYPPLVELAQHSYECNTLNEIICAKIKDEISSDSLKMFTKIAYQCLKRDRIERPLMTEVVKALEAALVHELNHHVGTLNVKVVRIMNLKRTLLFFERECFVKVRLTKDSLPSKKTNSIRSLNPEWNEEFRLVVKDLDVQALEISVWEGQDHPYKMWMNVVPLKDLIPEHQKTLTLDLLKHADSSHLENNKSYGQLMIELMYKPLTCEEVLTNSEEANEMNMPLKVGGWLVVTILEAEGIQVTHPFIYLTIQNDRRQTTLAKKSFDPVWNEEIMFSFDKPPTNEILNLELHSSSQISKFLHATKRGHVNISLEDIVKKTRTKEMYHLEDTTSGGRLHVELQWRTSFS